MIGEGSSTIPQGSTLERVETATLFKFYVLIDPRDSLIKYVGRTVDLKNRFRNHIYEARKNNRNKRERWIVSLLRRNLEPELKVIYEKVCTLSQAISIERMLVKKIGKRYTLKNEPDHYLGAMFNGTPVHQYSLTGEYLATYPNANQAQIKTGVKDVNITRCCKNPNGYGTKTAGGYFWSYIKYKRYPHEYLQNWRNLKGKPVVQFDLSGNKLATYQTARMAERLTGVCYKKISAVCNGRRKTAGGYIWKFEK